MNDIYRNFEQDLLNRPTPAYATIGVLGLEGSVQKVLFEIS